MARWPSWPPSVSHSLGVLPKLELLGLLVELRDGALVHHADPGIVVRVEFEIERAFRPSRLHYRDRILRHLAGLRIHLAEEHLTEVGVPDVARAIEHHVVRLNQGIWQIVFGDDHMRGLAREPRLGLKRESPSRLLAQIDAGEPFRGLPAVAAAFHIASWQCRRAAAALGECCRDNRGSSAGSLP